MIQAIAWDLDDTLLDTHRLLVNSAAKKACEKMIAAGLSCSLEVCLEKRREKAPHFSHHEIFHQIAVEAGNKNSDELGKLGEEVFYNPELPESLPLMDGAENLLKHFYGKLPMFLVTAGNLTAQKNKVAVMKIEKYFQSIHYCEPNLGTTKLKAFEKILQTIKIDPKNLLVIGNRLSQEISAGKKLEATTVYLEYGEHVGEARLTPSHIPDYTIYKLEELLSLPIF